MKRTPQTVPVRSNILTHWACREALAIPGVSGSAWLSTPQLGFVLEDNHHAAIADPVGDGSILRA